MLIHKWLQISCETDLEMIFVWVEVVKNSSFPSNTTNTKWKTHKSQQTQKIILNNLWFQTHTLCLLLITWLWLLHSLVSRSNHNRTNLKIPLENLLCVSSNINVCFFVCSILPLLSLFNHFLYEQGGTSNWTLETYF